MASEIQKVQFYTGESRIRLTLGDGTYIEIIPDVPPKGRPNQTYLWVGDDKRCYSTSHPPSTQALRKFAKAILRAVGDR